MPDQGNSPPHNEGHEAKPSSEEKSSPLAISGPVTVRLETLANILTAAVALSAILLSVWEGLENRRHNRLSVLPHLEPIEASYASATPIEHEYFLLPSGMDSLFAVGYALKNSGLGPAVLDNVLVFEGEEKIYDAEQPDSININYLQEVRRDLQKLPFATSLLRNAYPAGAMLQAGEVHEFFTVTIPFASVNSDSLDRWPPRIVVNDVLETYSFVFCYCSVYGTNCDMVYLGGEPPVEKACGL